MSMAYEKPYWTKYVDLRLAIERLDEELGALEFDANHEAVYGLEKYYTVRECEQLQDKYEKGKKICTKFLQGIYFALCLRVHLKKTGLEQFVDRIKIAAILTHHPMMDVKKTRKNMQTHQKKKKRKNKNYVRVSKLLEMFIYLAKDVKRMCLRSDNLFNVDYCNFTINKIGCKLETSRAMIDVYVPPSRRQGNVLLEPDLTCLDALNPIATRDSLQSSESTRWKSSYASKLDAFSPNLVITSNTKTSALPSTSSTYVSTC
ncbi:hypothetical protein FQA39_LY17788 [Lamprigera yunnana]|nr:hypothetical protein FQA39_LY17788 [Lamprigera yunnana]